MNSVDMVALSMSTCLKTKMEDLEDLALSPSRTAKRLTTRFGEWTDVIWMAAKSQ